VRRRTNSGWLRHVNVTDWPGWIGARSISIEASASTSADGFIWSMNGHKVAAAPTAPMAPVAMKRKSRRVGSAVCE
jgi:hypothetical protein